MLVWWLNSCRSACGCGLLAAGLLAAVVSLLQPDQLQFAHMQCDTCTHTLNCAQTLNCAHTLTHCFSHPQDDEEGEEADAGKDGKEEEGEQAAAKEDEGEKAAAGDAAAADKAAAAAAAGDKPELEEGEVPPTPPTAKQVRVMVAVGLYERFCLGGSGIQGFAGIFAACRMLPAPTPRCFIVPLCTDSLSPRAVHRLLPRLVVPIYPLLRAAQGGCCC